MRSLVRRLRPLMLRKWCRLCLLVTHVERARENPRMTADALHVVRVRRRTHEGRVPTATIRLAAVRRLRRRRTRSCHAEMLTALSRVTMARVPLLRYTLARRIMHEWRVTLCLQLIARSVAELSATRTSTARGVSNHVPWPMQNPVLLGLKHVCPTTAWSK